MDAEILKSAENKKYTEFSDAIKAELKSKLAGHPTIDKYSSDYDRIQKMKDIFSQINTEFGSSEE